MKKHLGLIAALLGGLAAGAVIDRTVVPRLEDMFAKKPTPVVKEAEAPQYLLPLKDTYGVIAVGYNFEKDQSRISIDNAVKFYNEWSKRGAKLKLFIENPDNFPVPGSINAETPSLKKVLSAIEAIPSDKSNDVILYFSGDTRETDERDGISFTYSDNSEPGLLNDSELNLIFSEKDYRRLITVVRNPFAGHYGSKQVYKLGNALHLAFVKETDLGKFIKYMNKGFSTLDSFRSLLREYRFTENYGTVRAQYYTPEGKKFNSLLYGWNEGFNGGIITPKSLEEFAKEKGTRELLNWVEDMPNYLRQR
jgi:hypothetical protein